MNTPTEKPVEIPIENEVAATPAVVRATIEIIRAGTGKKEIFELVGTPIVNPTKE